MNSPKLIQNIKPLKKLTEKEVKLRDRLPNDDGFIIDSWCMSNRHKTLFGAIPKDIYFKFYRKFTVGILSISNVLVACNPEDENQIFGYCVYRFKGDVPIISYVFIKEAFQWFDIDEMLLMHISKDTKIVTHMKPRQETWLKSLGCVYNPFIDWKDYYEIRH